VPTMSNPQRALQLWSVLAFAAVRRTIVTFEEVEGLIGIPKFALGQALGNLAQYCEDRKLPWLTALVVRGGTGKPPDELDDMMDIQAEQWKCFQYDWLKHTPALEDVEKPWQKGNTAA